MINLGSIVIIKTFGNSVDAELFRLNLKAFGIPSFIYDDYTVSTNPFLAIAVGGIKIGIIEEDLDKLEETGIELDEYEEYGGNFNDKLLKMISGYFKGKGFINRILVIMIYLFSAIMITFRCETKTYEKMDSSTHSKR